jgi:serine/threonine protein kinase
MGCLPSKQQPKKRHHLAENCIVPREKNVTDDYDILKQIGRGSIGKIFLAEAKQPDYCNDEDTVRDQSMAHTSPGSPSWSIPSNDGKESALFLHDSSSTRSSRRKRQYYAIKEIDACCMIDVRAFDSLKTEIAVLRKLDHPYIIKFFGSYSVDCERLSVVMELCLGGSLDQGAPYPEATVKILVANVAEAVLYLHKHKVIHRDLKVRNSIS